jgi:hypothetical protein
MHAKLSIEKEQNIMMRCDRESTDYQIVLIDLSIQQRQKDLVS